MFYDKKIRYLNYIVGGERVKGCGFVKMEVRGGVCNLEVAVSGLPAYVACITDVWLCAAGNQFSLGKICLENGCGAFRLTNCILKEISPMGVSYEDWAGISIIPGESWEISSLWGEHCNCVLERVEVVALSGERVNEVIGEKAERREPDRERNKPRPTGQSELPQKAEELQKKTEEYELAEWEKLQELKDPKVRQESQKTQEPAPTEEMPEQEMPREEAMQQVRLAEDKWEQLSGIYPHVRPFRDKREYLSIRPADFVLLSAASYKAVNNSFLLHGYYNYHHLILARAVKRGQLSYYVGTPGNFFEREKQVAIMFGFTGFECAKDPAGEGDFGYYLMEVQL